MVSGPPPAIGVIDSMITTLDKNAQDNIPYLVHLEKVDLLLSSLINKPDSEFEGLSRIRDGIKQCSTGAIIGFESSIQIQYGILEGMRMILHKFHPSNSKPSSPDSVSFLTLHDKLHKQIVYDWEDVWGSEVKKISAEFLDDVWNIINKYRTQLDAACRNQAL